MALCWHKAPLVADFPWKRIPKNSLSSIPRLLLGRLINMPTTLSSVILRSRVKSVSLVTKSFLVPGSSETVRNISFSSPIIIRFVSTIGICSFAITKNRISVRNPMVVFEFKLGMSTPLTLAGSLCQSFFCWILFKLIQKLPFLLFSALFLVSLSMAPAMLPKKRPKIQKNC